MKVIRDWKETYHGTMDDVTLSAPNTGSNSQPCNIFLRATRQRLMMMRAPPRSGATRSTNQDSHERATVEEAPFQEEVGT